MTSIVILSAVWFPCAALAYCLFRTAISWVRPWVMSDRWFGVFTSVLGGPCSLIVALTMVMVVQAPKGYWNEKVKW